MYKLLLVANRKEIELLFQEKINWTQLQCQPPRIAHTVEEAVEVLNTQVVDAIGSGLSKEEHTPLSRYLRSHRPSLPVFQVTDSLKAQNEIMADTVRLLDRLRNDFTDGFYDEEAMLTYELDHLIHQMLTREMTDWPTLERRLTLVRAPFHTQKPCILFDIDMPQGDVYLSEHHGHAQQRLENALRNNFFGRRVDGVYYAVCVMTPRHIQLVCLPVKHCPVLTEDDFAAQVGTHVQESIEKIKEYLDLDMNITSATWKSSLKAFLNEEET